MNNQEYQELVKDVQKDFDRIMQFIKIMLVMILLILIILTGLYCVLAFDLRLVTVEYLFPVDNWVLFEDGSFILLKKYTGCIPWSICN